MMGNASSDGAASGVRTLHGVLPVLQVPFKHDQSIDHTSLADVAYWALGHGVDGLVIGMVSEVLRMSDRERVEIISTVAPIAEERAIPLVASVGADATVWARDRALAAVAAGATAVMATPPLLVEADDAALLRYFIGIAEAANVPLVVQDSSGYVGRPVSVDVQASLQRELGDVVFFKPEAHPLGQRLSRLRDLTAGQAGILDGTGGLTLSDNHRRGVIGAMPATDVCWALTKLWRALEREDLTTAARIQGPLTALISLQTTLDAFVTIEKHLLWRQGVIANAAIREPSSYKLDPETAAEAERLTAVLRDACSCGDVA